MFWIDSNILIQASRGPYAFDLAPGFWAFLDDRASKGDLCSSILVHDEMASGSDELANWVRQRKSSGLFRTPSQAVQSALTNVADYANATYEPSRATLFLAGADPWLIAHAMTDGGVVATHEVVVPASSKKPKIPNVCNNFGVVHCDPWKMLRDLGMKLT